MVIVYNTINIILGIKCQSLFDGGIDKTPNK